MTDPISWLSTKECCARLGVSGADPLPLYRRGTVGRLPDGPRNPGCKSPISRSSSRACASPLVLSPICTPTPERRTMLPFATARLPRSSRTNSSMSDCLFCKIVAGDVPATVVADTDDVLAFRDLNPVAPTHVLVIPKRHIVGADEVVAADGDVLRGHVRGCQAGRFDRRTRRPDTDRVQRRRRHRAVGDAPAPPRARRQADELATSWPAPIRSA